MSARDLVGDSYVDALGTPRIVPASTREAFIALLEASEVERIAAPVRVLVEGEPLTIDVTMPAAHWNERLLWTLRAGRDGIKDSVLKAETVLLKDAPVIRFAQRGGITYDTRRVTFPVVIPIGDYRLTIDVGTIGHASVSVVVGCERAYLPFGEGRVWGIATQLYALRSATNWGIGDFTDLRRACMMAADAGARYVGINPIHASHRTDPESASPYSPASRRFLNWLCIDVAALPEARHGKSAEFIASIASTIDALRAAPYVDYTGVAEVKEDALRLCFGQLRGERLADFRAFARTGGLPLRRFATYEVLVEKYGRNLFAWPAELTRAGTPAVEAFAGKNLAAVEFAMYLQFCAATQLAEVSAAAAERGVAIYRDLAVGVELNSADVWAEPGFVRTVSVGAPPDILNTRGQDWGLPPTSPAAMQDDGYGSFAGLLADNMRDAGALRIDHAMSLMRLFWIPRGAGASTGAYIGYPFEEMLTVLARESTRAKCIVVGEDLGTVPAGFRERMSAANVLSYRILLFERNADGSFIGPEAYPELALAATGTHDLPPFPGWLAGEDIALRERLGMVDPDVAETDRIERRRDIMQLRDALDAHDAGPEELVLAAYRFLARTPAHIVMLQLEDAIGETTSVNVPGTDREHPNWRRKLSADLETIAGGEPFGRFAAALRELRPRE